jgi:TetR/AcrR family transcriptional repressor of nem operon
MAEPLTRKGRATRDRIVATAAEMFQRRGVRGTSVEHVLAATGTGTGQFYRYFPSKADLVSAVIAYHFDRYLGSQSDRLLELVSLEELARYLRELTDRYAQRGLVGGCPLGSLAAELADQDERLRGELAEVFARWQASLEAGLSSLRDAGALRPDADPGRLAAMTVAAIQGGYLLATVSKDVAAMEATLDGALAHIRGFAAAPA